MTITYSIGDSLYVNVTNCCLNDCEFCIRRLSDTVGGSGSLWLEREPSREEIFADILGRSMSKYSEIVFCGYGEPTQRLDDLLWVCAELKKTGAPPIRVNTNGQASLCAGYDTAPSFLGLVDVISISLNAPDADEYNKLCKPGYGEKTYEAILDFAKKVKEYVPEVILSVVGGTTDVDACRKIADEMGLPLRIR